MAPPCDTVTDGLAKKKRTDMSALVCNCFKAVMMYIRHLDSCDVITSGDKSQTNDIKNRSDRKQTCPQDFGTYFLTDPV